MKLSPKAIRASLALVAILIAVVAALFAARGHDTNTDVNANAKTGSAVATTARPATNVQAPTTHAPGIPDRAYATLVEIDAGRWPGSANSPGTHGGDQWMNRGNKLPTSAAGKSISYQEWDVNPKQRNQTRDAQRIITGSDGSAYYTGDHYQTFTRMR